MSALVRRWNYYTMTSRPLLVLTPGLSPELILLEANTNTR